MDDGGGGGLYLVSLWLVIVYAGGGGGLLEVAGEGQGGAHQGAGQQNLQKIYYGLLIEKTYLVSTDKG